MKRAGKFWVPDAEELQIAALQNGDGWQLDRLDMCIRLVPRDRRRVAIDGGAHVGTWTVAMARYFSKVIAFEPAPDTFECLRLNVDEADGRRLIPSEIVLTQAALGDVRRSGLGMSDDGRYHGGNTGGRFIEGTGTVEMMMIDQLNIDALDFLKLDVEGYEWHALKGAERTIEQFRPLVLIEDKMRFAHRTGVPPHAAADFLIYKGARELDRIGADRVFGWD